MCNGNPSKLNSRTGSQNYDFEKHLPIAPAYARKILLYNSMGRSAKWLQKIG
jgi:hypothetical protein